jgi:hypothetical protein
VRPVIACITTLATVLHLAWGCCLHAAIIDGGATCCRPVATDRPADDCCEEVGHDHVPADDGPMAAATGHRCEDCRCAAMIDAETVVGRLPASGAVAAAFAAGSIPRWQAARGPCGSVGPPVLSALRPPLFERLSV